MSHLSYIALPRRKAKRDPALKNTIIPLLQEKTNSGGEIDIAGKTEITG
jgi:hypothetical protein